MISSKLVWSIVNSKAFLMFAIITLSFIGWNRQTALVKQRVATNNANNNTKIALSERDSIKARDGKLIAQIGVMKFNAETFKMILNSKDSTLNSIRYELKNQDIKVKNLKNVITNYQQIEVDLSTNLLNKNKLIERLLQSKDSTEQGELLIGKIINKNIDADVYYENDSLNIKASLNNNLTILIHEQIEKKVFLWINWSWLWDKDKLNNKLNANITETNEYVHSDIKLISIETDR